MLTSKHWRCATTPCALCMRQFMCSMLSVHHMACTGVAAVYTGVCKALKVVAVRSFGMCCTHTTRAGHV